MSNNAEYANAAQKAAAIREMLPAASIDFDVNPDDSTLVSPDVYKLFFDLQIECEKTGQMNYHEYARRLWNKYFGKDHLAEGPVFTEFEANLIRGLHEIKMTDTVFDEINDSSKLKKLTDALYENSARVILWSTGDVSATGYQDAKISSSRAVHNFMRSLSSNDDGKIRLLKNIKEKTEYLVRDNKMLALEEYLKTKQPPFKIAVIEDTRGNIDRVTDLAKKLFNNAQNVEVIPVWATYSRAGKTEKNKNPIQYNADKAKYNGLNSLAELSSSDWQKKLQGAEILVDFDGVISDNGKMRNAQAQIKLQSLRHAAAELKFAETELFKKL